MGGKTVRIDLRQSAEQALDQIAASHEACEEGRVAQDGRVVDRKAQ